MMLTAAAAPPAAEKQSSQNLILLALGVVYGDIGTSPLYALGSRWVTRGRQ